MPSSQELIHLKIPLQELSDATNGFSEQNLIAKGGFGKVYKGVSEKHGMMAIKKLDHWQGEGRGQGDPEFKTEIALLSVYKHENIVSLLGFCDDDGQKILVYNYESNGSLERHLNSANLTWIQRLQICLDAATGLRYLHEDDGSHQRILHRDVKSSNILLDENWRAKISDFGLSRMGPANVEDTFVFTRVCGTPGYVDPDYYLDGYLTQKSDVYSFGVVLFEVMCGRPTRVTKDVSKNLIRLVQNHWQANTLGVIIFPDIQGQINRASFRTFSSIAYQCLMSGNERPTMMKVVEQLQKALKHQLASSGTHDGDDLSALLQGQLGLSQTSSSSPSWKYDVFISFRGGDTRKTFVDHLYFTLQDRQILTFKDDEELTRGEPIVSSLLKAIQESKIAIIVFSKNYADSSWCLDELTTIMKNRDEGRQTVIPIFYDVEPSEVRKQTRYYGEALARHELENKNKVESWREALVKAGSLSGWDIRTFANGHEAKAIRQICDDISQILLGITEYSRLSWCARQV